RAPGPPWRRRSPGTGRAAPSAHRLARSRSRHSTYGATPTTRSAAPPPRAPATSSLRPIISRSCPASATSPSSRRPTGSMRCCVRTWRSIQPEPASQIPRATRECQLPDLVAVLVEHQLRIGRRREPDIVRHLVVELACAPTRIAEREQALLRSGLGRHVAQDLRARGERHPAIDRERTGTTVLGTVQYQHYVGLNRASAEHRHARSEERRVG